MSDTDQTPTVVERPARALTREPSVSPARSGRRGGGFGWVWFGVGLSLAIATAGIVWWMFFVRPVESNVGALRLAVAHALERITGQQVTVSANTVTLRKTNIAELNVAQRKTQTILRHDSTRLGSKATLILRGDFVVKAGFDLTQPFSVQFDEQTGEVKADFPPAKITSVELVNYEVFFSDSGVINKIRPEDQEMAIQQMLTQARLEAERSDMKEDAEAQLARRLRDLLGPKAEKVLLRDTEVLP